MWRITYRNNISATEVQAMDSSILEKNEKKKYILIGRLKQKKMGENK